MKFYSSLSELSENISRNETTTSFPEAVDAFFTDRNWIQYSIPMEPGGVLSLSRWIAYKLKFMTPVTLIVDSGGILPSWEDDNLYRLLRKSKGGTTEYASGHCMIFEPYEKDDFVTFLYVISLFRWDFRVFCFEADFAMASDHDDHVFLDVGQLNSDDYDVLTKMVDKLTLGNII